MFRSLTPNPFPFQYTLKSTTNVHLFVWLSFEIIKAVNPISRKKKQPKIVIDDETLVSITRVSDILGHNDFLVLDDNFQSTHSQIDLAL